MHLLKLVEKCIFDEESGASESSLPNYFFPSSVFLYGDDPELCPSLVHLASDISKYGKFALFHAESLTGHATNIAVLDVDDKQLFPEETKSKGSSYRAERCTRSSQERSRNNC